MGINVALDGPSGAGKSTIAKAVAKKLEYVYVDTGAMYRSIAYYVISKGADLSDPEQIKPLLGEISIKLCYTEAGQRVMLNDEDVSDKIRTPEISMGASKVSAIPEVREFLLELQKNIAKENNIIMDGRDIGTVVLPNADVKIFLTAAPEARAERRFRELQEKGDKSTYDEVLQDIIQRDYNDTHREIAPLKKADDAVEVDSTELTLEESVEAIYKVITDKTKKKERKIKEIMPDAFIGVDVIVGTRGETDEYFESAYDFINGLDVTQLHVFSYSERPGTQALKIDYVVTPEKKHERSQRLLALSEEKTRAFYAKHIGQTMEVLLEKPKPGAMMHGFTKNYIRVEVDGDHSLDNKLVQVKLGDFNEDSTALRGIILGMSDNE